MSAMGMEMSEISLIDTRTPDPKKFIKGATGDWELVMLSLIHI